MYEVLILQYLYQLYSFLEYQYVQDLKITYMYFEVFASEPGRKYSEHALERMAPDIVQVRAELTK
ncbi:hypothetical protein IIC_04470 [Bacillus cereus VD021]|uniref:Uncharacterized protein n=1 Tax=Bacillus cereus VD021 TaxID=1053224 RepID=R8HDS4_BACCE|nr:hypothetical protein IIC_04470 [Bacillus cereus VD021]GAE43068.1 hypothetical protein BW1_079_00530 [Bacillus mycoides NBRC 101238 = DSM 11821]